MILCRGTDVHNKSLSVTSGLVAQWESYQNIYSWYYISVPGILRNLLPLDHKENALDPSDTQSTAAEIRGYTSLKYITVAPNQSLYVNPMCQGEILMYIQWAANHHKATSM